MIGDLVPIDNEDWTVFLLLRTIMDIIFSPTVTLDLTYTLDGLIEQHHTMFMQVCLNLYFLFSKVKQKHLVCQLVQLLLWE